MMITDQIDKELLALAKQSDIELDPVYRRIDAVCMTNSDQSRNEGKRGTKEGWNFCFSDKNVEESTCSRSKKCCRSA